MNILVKIAWRNIWRHPGRSSVLLAAIVAGIWAGVTVSAVSNGFVQQRFDRLVDEVSHIQVHHPAYRTERDIGLTIPDAQEVIQYLDSLGVVDVYSARVLTDAMIQSPVTTAGVQIRGIDPAREDSTTGIGSQMSRGSYFNSDVQNAIVLGESVAEKLNVDIGTRVVLTFQDLEDNLVSEAFNVIGIYSTPSTLEDRLVYTRLSDLQAGLGSDVYHEIAVVLRDDASIDSLAVQISQQFPSSESLTWYELSPELRLYTDMGNQVTYYLMIIILLALAFGIVNTMLMAIFERIQELGVLMAIGMNRVRIFSMITLESFFITMTGTVIGMIFSIVCIRYLYLNGLDLSMFGEGLAEFGYSSVIYPFLSVGTFVTITFMVALTSILASIYPAIKAVKLKPAVAVHE